LIYSKKTWPIFAFFCLYDGPAINFVVNMMPETKGLSLEELEHKMQNNGK
jgi:hypothetical protein